MATCSTGYLPDKGMAVYTDKAVKDLMRPDRAHCALA